MKIYEYQAKQFLARYGIKVQPGDVAETPDEAYRIAEQLGTKVVIKAQVHAGGRGKAGGIKLARTPEEAREKAEAILGMKIKDITVSKLLVLSAVDIESESYAGLVMDRRTKKPVFMVSPAGGIDIEQIARKTPEKILKYPVDPFFGLMPSKARELASFLYSDRQQVKRVMPILSGLYRMFIENDCSLAEINPLVVDKEGVFWAVDAKINLDDNGLSRHPEFEKLRDPEIEAPQERVARESNLSYVKLEGNIACCVNGAGLAMTTMDVIKYYGGEPANFLDIGGSSNPKKVVNALRIIKTDPNVEVILFNIFGGITRCDDVAEGLKEAILELNIGTPVVVRLTGTNEQEARKILSSMGIEVHTSMDEAVKCAVALVGKEKR